MKKPNTKLKYYVLIFGRWWRISEKSFDSGKWYKYFTKKEKENK